MAKLIPKTYQAVEQITALEDVEFVCPRCGAERPGSIVDRRRCASLVGRPIVPLERLERRVQCHTCGHLAGLGVLDVMTISTLQGCVTDALRRSIAYVVRADDPTGEIDDDVIDEAIDVMLLAGTHYSATALAADVQRIDRASLYAALRPLASELTAHGKQRFVERLISIGLVRGMLSRPAQRALLDIGVALQMAPRALNEVLTSASSCDAAIAAPTNDVASHDTQAPKPAICSNNDLLEV